MPKLYGRNNSVNVKKALWCLEELKLPYERIEAGLQHGVVNTPEYRRLNPNGLVPTLVEDDGFVLWESHTIVRYLSARHGKGVLWPLDERDRAIANQWMDWAFTFQGAVRNAFWNLIRTAPEKRDAAAIEESRARAISLLPMLDAALTATPYVAGPQLSMGDIPIGCEVQRWMRLPLERPAFPAVERWFERLCARPAFSKVVDLPLT